MPPVKARHWYSRISFHSDRSRELASMFAVIFAAAIFPAGLLASVFVPQGVQWGWLAYQLYATFARHTYRFGGGRWAGATEAWVVQELRGQKTVSIDGVLVTLEQLVAAKNVGAGRAWVECWLADLKKQEGRSERGGEEAVH